MLDVAAPGVELLDLGPIDVEAHTGEPRPAKGPHERKPDVSHADDAPTARAIVDRLQPGVIGQQWATAWHCFSGRGARGSSRGFSHGRVSKCRMSNQYRE